MDISQKSQVNRSVFIRGEDVVFKVQLHDPSGYLKTAASVDFIWDFSDGNQLVTRRDVATHTYSTLGNMSVKLVVEAAFPAACLPTSATPTARLLTSPPHKGTETTRWGYAVKAFGEDKDCFSFSESFHQKLRKYHHVQYTEGKIYTWSKMVKFCLL